MYIDARLTSKTDCPSLTFLLESEVSATHQIGSRFDKQYSVPPTPTGDLKAVSYTHLDVYKRQLISFAGL